MNLCQAINNIRQLGDQFAMSLFDVTGKPINVDSRLMNGLAAYEILNLKGEFDYIDESVDIVMKTVYKMAKEQAGL